MVNMTALSDVLYRARKNAEDLMTDTCSVKTLVGSQLDDWGVSKPVYATVYEGACKVQTYGGMADQTSGSATGESTNVGGAVPIWNLMIHFPHRVGSSLHVGDVVMVESSQDETLVGRRMRLVNLQSEKTFATAARWNVSEIPQGDQNASD